MFIILENCEIINKQILSYIIIILLRVIIKACPLRRAMKKSDFNFHFEHFIKYFNVFRK